MLGRVEPGMVDGRRVSSKRQSSGFTPRMTKQAFACGRWLPSSCQECATSAPSRIDSAFSNERRRHAREKIANQRRLESPSKPRPEPTSRFERAGDKTATASNFHTTIAHLPPPVQRSAIIELFINHAANRAADAAATISLSPTENGRANAEAATWCSAVLAADVGDC
jgi:hypothetical protein